MKTKQEVRKHINDQFLQYNTNVLHHKELDIQKKIMEYIHISQFQNICIYVGTKNEVPTLDLLTHLIKQKKNVYIPQVISETHMGIVKLDTTSQLNNGAFGILESGKTDYYTGEIDVFIIPGVAFTKTGKRLGKGKGYYDRFLSQDIYKDSKKVGVCYDFQICNNIPCDTWDIPMDKVLSK